MLIVLRAHPSLPDGFMPRGMDGKWIEVEDREFVPLVEDEAVLATVRDAVAVFSGRYERRDPDGATAPVFEIRP